LRDIIQKNQKKVMWQNPPPLERESSFNQNKTIFYDSEVDKFNANSEVKNHFPIWNLLASEEESKQLR
jgi:hypothetical protein